MTELQDNTTEMQNKHIASSQTKKAKGSALDRGFPTGTVLILLVILVIILQGISAWKVINLESERAAIEKKGALLKKDIHDFDKLKRELPALKSERDLLRKDIPELEGTKHDLARQVANIGSQLAQARETIERSKQAEKIKIDLENAANKFKTEIENKTNEIMRLAGPNSLIQKSAGDLQTLINNLDTAPEQLDQVIIQTKRQINSSLITVNKASTSLQSEVTSFSSTSRSMVADLQRVSEIATNVTKKVKGAEEKLSQQTKKLSKSSKQFTTQIDAIDNNLESLKNSNQKFSNETTKVARIASDINSTADKFKQLYADTEQAVMKFNGYTSRSFVLQENFRLLFKTIAKRIKNPPFNWQPFPIEAARSIWKVLSLRENGANGLTRKEAEAIIQQILTRLRECIDEINSKPVLKRERLFFQNIRLFLYLLRFRIVDTNFLNPENPKDRHFFDSVINCLEKGKEYFQSKSGLLPGFEDPKAAGASGLLDEIKKYMHYEGTKDLVHVLKEFAGDD